MSSITNSSTDETQINSPCVLKSDVATGDNDNTEENRESDGDADAIDQSESVQTLSSNDRKRKLDEDVIKPAKIPKIETNILQTEKRSKNEQSTEKSICQSECNADGLGQSSETVQCSSGERKHKSQDDDELTKIPKYDTEPDIALSDVPSDLCSVRSDRNVKIDDGKITDNSAVVAGHYNAIEEKGLSYRSQSRIFFMRNFNNWIKSMLINEYLRKVRQFAAHGTPLRVMDMCCGKGGDLLKWKKANISHLICADIADVSVKQCENRYKEIVSQSGNDRGFTPVFTAEFITADCAKVRLREKYKDPSLQLDLVSCQFALHYSFESLPQAMCMLQNASESLKPGGYFIATLPDANDLVYQWRKADGNKFGNNIYNVEFCCNKDDIPLFGAKYNFHLEGVVDCPEFLVYLPLLKKLALKLGLEFVSFERFDEFYERHQQEGKSLLGKMQALETYPPYHEAPLLGQNPQDYQDALHIIWRCGFQENENFMECRRQTGIREIMRLTCTHY
ncbi:hypothetical protein PV327_006096 [Microctonus hyperodae]|uniref:mRNA (guanine-N(7))-methyltransferase n=1 Tax=Microctonus hyperodae TaxID=165561 RepID=A0AA39G2T0_MICHY|nr:hypothetical protein PV327_006096 [Microctonus hyperodae]